MYDMRVNFSSYIKSSVENLTINISTEVNIDMLRHTMQWALLKQLFETKEICFSFAGEINFNVLQCLLLTKEIQPDEIILKEEGIYFGDYLQLHNATIKIYNHSLKQWFDCMVNTLKCSLDNSKGHTVLIDEDYIVI